ncbi:MAG: ABC transporter permease [Phycisphaeraceae bacterium]|nr:ABC transporter permease [Phycisphaeraceae bacterium]
MSRPGRTAPRVWWPLIALAALTGFNLLWTDGFARLGLDDGVLRGPVVDVVRNAAPLVIIAVGMALVIATAGVDLSVGSTLAMAGAVVAVLLTGPRWGPVPAIAAGLGAGLGIGLVAGVLVSGIGLQPIVATLVLLACVRGGAQLLTDGRTVSFQDSMVLALASGHIGAIPVPVVVAGAWLVGLVALVRTTALGLFLEAIGDNPVAARLAGVPVARVMMFAYVVAGVGAALAGIIVAADIRAADPTTAGKAIELDAILAVVLGGTALAGGRFSLCGAAVGAVLIKLLDTTVVARGVPAQATLVVKAGVVLVVCVLLSDRFRAALLGGLGRR